MTRACCWKYLYVFYKFHFFFLDLRGSNEVTDVCDTQNYASWHQVEQQHQQQQQQQRQQQQQLLLLEKIQQHIQQFESPDVQHQTVSLGTQSRENSLGFQYATIYHQNETDQIPIRPQYPEPNSLSPVYYPSESMPTNSVQMYNSVLGCVGGEENTQEAETLTQNESFGNFEPSVSHVFGFVASGQKSHVGGGRFDYGGGYSQGQIEGYNQGYATQVQGHHQGQDHHQGQGYHEGQGHHRSQLQDHPHQDQIYHQGQVQGHHQVQFQNHHQSQAQVHRQNQRQGELQGQFQGHHQSQTETLSERDDDVQGASKTGLNPNFVSLVSDQNKSLNRKNRLPSFHHLSSQLVASSQLLARY